MSSSWCASSRIARRERRNHLAERVLPDRRVGAQQVMVDDDDVGRGGALPHPGDVSSRRSAGTRCRGRCPRSRRPRARTRDPRADPASSARSPVSVRVDHSRMIGRNTSCDRRAGAVGQLIELVEAQIVRAPLHVGGGERDAERVAQRGNVLEVDLFLQVLGAGGDQHAFAAEDGGHEVGERLAGAGARFGEQDAAVLEDARHGRRHLDLSGARLEVGHRQRERAAGGEDGGDRLARRAGADADRPGRAVIWTGYSWYSGNFRHRTFDFGANHAERAIVVGRLQRAREQLADRCPSRPRACRAS